MTGQRFCKPLWNVRHDVAPERTTLTVERRERRWNTGRGYLVTADSPNEARTIVRYYGFQQRGYELAWENRVQLADDGKVIVLMANPRW